jgi:F1F0 ATPase subunit 2
MAMNETVILVLAGSAGVLLGVFFFGGLWWTVRKGPFVETAGALFLGSLLLRTSIMPGWILCCLRRSLGAAAGVSPRIRHRALHRDAAHPSPPEKPTYLAQEASHAP